MDKALVGTPSQIELAASIVKDQLIYLIMNLPFGCNYKCLKCYRLLNISTQNLYLELRKEKIKEARDLGASVLGIAGEGEPLTRWDIVRELIKYANSLSMTTILYTNCSLLDEEKINFLFDNNVTLMISCDSFNPITYQKLTENGDIGKVLPNLEMARSVYRHTIAKENRVTITRLGMISVACLDNKDEIPSLKKWCGNDIFFVCNPPIKEGKAIENWDILVGDQLDELTKIADEFTDTGHGGVSTPVANGRCAALYHGITIDTDGNILLCPASVETIVGNISDCSLSEARARTKAHIIKCGSPNCSARDGETKLIRSYHDKVIN